MEALLRKVVLFLLRRHYGVENAHINWVEVEFVHPLTAEVLHVELPLGEYIHPAQDPNLQGVHHA